MDSHRMFSLRNATPRVAALAALALTLSLLAPAARAQQSADDVSKSITALAETFEKANKASVGVSVVDLRTGKAVAAVHETALLMPASNQKLLTSAAALAKLGGNFQFTTKACLLGKDLVVLGDGDPTLGDSILAAESNTTIYAELDKWAAAIRAKVGDKFDGDILVCSDRPVFRSPEWPKNQYDRWYVAPIAELNFNNNCLDVYFTAQGGAIVPASLPESRFIQLVNKTAKGKHLWGLRYNADDSVVTVTGTVAQATKDPQSISVNDPPLLFGRVLADRLVRAGVAFTGKVKRVKTSSLDLSAAQGICQTLTPLGTAMKRANKRSLNMVAEAMFLRVGDGTWDGSARIMADTLTQAYDVAPETLSICDGSGLARKNGVAPVAITKILAGVLARKDAIVFVDSLPICGVDGTMERRLEQAPYRKRVLAKTGYIAGVSSLSGYVLDPAGKPVYAFSTLVNKVNGPAEAKHLEDQICALLVDSLGPAPAK